jgi:hypothetical protein
VTDNNGFWRQHWNKLQKPRPTRDIGHGPRSLTYLLYALIVWFSVFSDISALTLSLSNLDGDRFVFSEICKLPADPDRELLETTVTAAGLTKCEVFKSYGMYFALRRALPQDQRYALLIFQVVTLFLLAHAARVFLGAYFVKNDRSFISAKQEWLRGLTPRQRSVCFALEHILVLSHIFLLGLLAYQLKSGSSTGAVSIIVGQGLLFLFADVLYFKPLVNNAQKYESPIIVIVDFLTLLSALLLLNLLVPGLQRVPEIFLIGSACALAVLLALEFFVSYLSPLRIALSEAFALVLACFGMVIFDDETPLQ